MSKFCLLIATCSAVGVGFFGLGVGATEYVPIRHVLDADMHELPQGMPFLQFLAFEIDGNNKNKTKIKAIFFII
ncbi:MULTISPECIES: hypothetical protein [unclassified Gilliamella]|uniref:hypothetical protein n=1 Tax=unclassified Gilliamella TaxID=2685620 RepID=UPI001C3FFCCA|nr:hypothetical protein [Gilliamella apicola]